MRKEELVQLIGSLTTEEKVGQLIQLTGNFFDAEDTVMETGPLKKIGFNEETFDLYSTGSLLNVVEPKNIYEIQKKYLAKTKHNIPLLFMADVIYGYKTIFPIPIAQTCSWNFDLIEKAAKVMAKECYDSGIHVTFAPMVDIVRDIRWGRVLESPGEDPILAREYAKSMTKGIQGDESILPQDHLAACVKHFAAYGAPIAGKEYNGVELSEEALHNVYLPSYQAAIDAGSKLVMTAFNTLNGIPCTGNKWLNQEILREEFQFPGVLISDYAAIEELKVHGYTENDLESAKMAIENTVDIDMKTSVYANHLPALANENPEIMKLLDDSVLRVLELKNDLGLFEDPYRGLDPLDFSKGERLTTQHRQTSLQLAEESVVLLKNEQVLPLKKAEKVAVIGPYGEEKATIGFWAITGDTKDTVSLLEGLKQLADEGIVLPAFAKGCNILPASEVDQYDKYSQSIDIDTHSEESLLEEAIKVASNADTIVLALGESTYQSGEGGSRTTPCLPKNQVKLLKALKKLGKKIILIVYAGRPLLLDEIVWDVAAILYAWFPGTMSGQALANILYGKANPCAKLSMTFPRSVGQLPIYYNSGSTGRPVQASNPKHRFASRYLDEDNSPLYCFGYGQSYTEFAYGKVELDKESMDENGTITASVTVKNTGSYAGKEIVQLYLQDTAASVVRPVKELKDFQKVILDSGEEKTLQFKITEQQLRFYSPKEGWISESGAFNLFIGKDSEDNQQQGRFYLIKN